MKITRDELREIYDYTDANDRVRSVVREAFVSLPGAIRFVARYAAWNSVFGSGVASLASKIGRSRQLFTEEGFPRPLSDRSVLVASWFFDAARDEFDDRDTEYRDTHRCLAQAMLAGVVEYAAQNGAREWASADYVEEQLAEVPWLEHLRARVASGYGLGSPDDRPAIFRAIGYHLGSELLADREFSTLDEALRASHRPLVEALSTRTITIAGQPHPCYQWLRIHSSHGGGAEEDHFKWALQGVEIAFRFVPQPEHHLLRHCVMEGYQAFVRDHQEFFERVTD